MLIGKLRNFFIKIRKRIECDKRRRKLKTKDFTIISNNCWGGFVYQYYGLRYTSPTIGLFFIGNDYVKFCKNLKYYVHQELKFIPFESSKNHMIIGKDKPYPVAKLDDIEIYFMHYSSEKEAAEKWYRRCKRINWDNLIYKISQREGYTREDIMEFIQIEADKKISFSYDKIEGSFHVKELEGFIGDETELLRNYCDFDEILNKDINKHEE